MKKEGEKGFAPLGKFSAHASASCKRMR